MLVQERLQMIVKWRESHSRAPKITLFSILNPFFLLSKSHTYLKFVRALREA